MIVLLLLITVVNSFGPGGGRGSRDMQKYIKQRYRIYNNNNIIDLYYILATTVCGPESITVYYIARLG